MNFHSAYQQPSVASQELVLALRHLLIMLKESQRHHIIMGPGLITHRIHTRSRCFMSRGIIRLLIRLLIITTIITTTITTTTITTTTIFNMTRIELLYGDLWQSNYLYRQVSIFSGTIFRSLLWLSFVHCFDVGVMQLRYEMLFVLILLS